MKTQELHRLTNLLHAVPDDGSYLTSVEILDRLATTYGGSAKYQSKLKQINRDLETLRTHHPNLEFQKEGDRRPVKVRWPMNEKPLIFGASSKGAKRLISKNSLTRDQLVALVYLQKLSRHSMPQRVKRFMGDLLEDIVEHSAEEVRSLRPNDTEAELRGLANKWVAKIHSIPERIEFVEPQVHPDVEAAIYDALLREQGLLITYKVRTDTIRVYPVGLVQQGVRSYLVGFKEQEQFPRTYLLTRILTAQVVPHAGLIPVDFRLEEHLQRGIAYPRGKFFDESEYGREISLRLRVHRSTQWLKETPLSLDQECVPVDGQDDSGDFFLSATLKLSENLVWWLLSMSWNVTVLAPETLRLRLSHDLQVAVENYKNPI